MNDLPICTAHHFETATDTAGLGLCEEHENSYVSLCQVCGFFAVGLYVGEVPPCKGHTHVR